MKEGLIVSVCIIFVFSLGAYCMWWFRQIEIDGLKQRGVHATDKDVKTFLKMEADKTKAQNECEVRAFYERQIERLEKQALVDKLKINNLNIAFLNAQDDNAELEKTLSLIGTKFIIKQDGETLTVTIK